MNCVFVYVIEGTGTTFCEYKFSYNRERQDGKELWILLSNRRQASNGIRCGEICKQWFPPDTQDLQYLQCVVLRGGLLFRYSFAQMRLTFSWKQIKAGERGSGTHLNAHWRRYNPFQKYRQQILSLSPNIINKKYCLRIWARWETRYLRH